VLGKINDLSFFLSSFTCTENTDLNFLQALKTEMHLVIQSLKEEIMKTEHCTWKVHVCCNFHCASPSSLPMKKQTII
jgi:hypothetical protein